MANIMYQSLAMQEVRLGRREDPLVACPPSCASPAGLRRPPDRAPCHCAYMSGSIATGAADLVPAHGGLPSCLALNRPLSPGLRRRLPPSTTPQGLFACAGVGPGDPAAFSAASAGLNCADDRLPYSTAELNAPEYSTDDFRMFNFKVRTDHQLRAPERAR